MKPSQKRGRPRKAVFLDRDGTLIEDKIYLNDPEQIFFLPGTFEALRLLRDSGYLFFVATNQSGVARGIVDIKNLYEIHRRIRARLAIHGIDVLEFYYAPYMTDTGHFCRKPNPGMLLRGADEYNLDLSSSWMIGDKMTDVEAGHRAGARSVLLGQLPAPGQIEATPPEIHTGTLLDAARKISQWDKQCVSQINTVFIDSGL